MQQQATQFPPATAPMSKRELTPQELTVGYNKSLGIEQAPEKTTGRKILDVITSPFKMSDKDYVARVQSVAALQEMLNKNTTSKLLMN